MTVFSILRRNQPAEADMQHARSAILAFVIIVTTACHSFETPTLAADHLKSPLRTRFQLIDGARVQGDITEWDQAGITGTFGRRAWSEIQLDDVWRLYRILMPADQAHHWINLGELLLTVPGGERFADRAFASALRIDPASQPAIEHARARAAAIIEERRKQQAKTEQHKLSTGNPEAKNYSTDRWPSLSALQQSQFVDELKTEALAAYTRAGVDPTFIETQRFLFYSQMDRDDALQWARLLDRTYEILAQALQSDPRDPAANNIFQGKAVVICFDDYDRFQLTEAEMFNHLSPRAITGLMHPRDAEVFINVWRDPDDVSFGETLCRLATFAYLHRHKAPRRLPLWANEGLALFVTERALERSSVKQLHRARGINYIRSGGDVRPLLTLEYQKPGDETPTPDDAVTEWDLARDVGYLFIETLIRENRDAFQPWVAAVKTGKEWPAALSDAYNVPAATIVDRVAQWYRVNN